jgi:hypothetical protein
MSAQFPDVTNPIDALRSVSGDFAQSLVRQFDQRRSLSPKQWFWVEKLVREAQQPAAPRAEISLANVVRLFATASKKLKYPKLTFVIDGETIKFQRAGAASKNPGSINITDGGSFGSNRWYGRIDLDGRWVPSREATPAVIALVGRLAADLIAAAVQYGHHSGHCCFCALELTDARSTEAGYGPVCAKNWELPWGAKESR